MDHPRPNRRDAGKTPCGGNQPLLLVAVAFAFGIGASRLVWNPPLHWALASLFLLIAAFYFLRRRPWISFSVALVSVAMAGSFALETSPSPVSPALPSRLLEGECTIAGYVIRDGLMRPGLFGGEQQSVDIQATSITTSGGTRFDSPTGIRLSIYTRHSELDAEDGTAASFPIPVLRYGQRLELTARLHEPRNYGNPGAWDYRGYLNSQGIALLGSSRAASVKVLPGTSVSQFGRWRNRGRAAVVAGIHRLWPAEQASLLDAMLIGVRSEIGRDLKVSFQSTGTFHILVVSGMNVGILGLGMFWLFRKLPTGDVVATVLTLILSFGYAWLTDLGAPIIRSVWTLSIYLLTRLLHRDASPLNAIGIAGLVILVWNPRALFDPSFQLTFLSVLAIGGIAVPWIDRITQPCRNALRHLLILRYDRALSPALVQFRLDLRLICGRLEPALGTLVGEKVIVWPIAGILWVWDLVLISLLMEFALALPMAWYFHRLTLMAPLANALVVPATSILMPAAVLALLAALLSFKLAAVPAVVAGGCLKIITGTVVLFGHLRISNIRVATPQVWLAAAALAALAVAITLARRRYWLAAAGTALAIVAGSAILFLPPKPQLRPGILEITTLDVGQGDSLFIAFPDGRTMLLDAGGTVGAAESGFDVGEQVVSPYLWSRGITHLDAVAFSHPHADHVGGLPAVMRNFQPSELWYGFAPPTVPMKRLLQVARDQHIAMVRRTQGEVVEYGGTQIRVLLPALNDKPHQPPRDDDVLALRISLGNSSAFLIGDTPKSREVQIVSLARGGAGLLKVAHHGSATSTCDEFLDAVHPQFAVISVGARNSFRHPRPEVLARLAQHGVKTYRTDLLGASTFYLDGTRTTVSPDRR